MTSIFEGHPLKTRPFPSSHLGSRYIYIYIYIERERERQKERDRRREREREREKERKKERKKNRGGVFCTIYRHPWVSSDFLGGWPDLEPSSYNAGNWRIGRKRKFTAVEFPARSQTNCQCLNCYYQTCTYIFGKDCLLCRYNNICTIYIVNIYIYTIEKYYQYIDHGWSTYLPLTYPPSE